MLTEEQIEKINNNNGIILSTCNNKLIPHCIVVLPSRVEKNRMILCNIQMNTSINNLRENNNCFIDVYLKEDNDSQIKINGIATLLESGELFDEIKNYEEENNLPEDLRVHTVIVIDYKNIEISEE